MELTRHADLIKGVNLDRKIVVVGAGSIGSYAVLALAKLGFNNIHVYDDGIVEEENISPQWYTERAIGVLKVEALKIEIRRHTGITINVFPIRIDSETTSHLASHTILISAVDSMEARKLLIKTLGQKGNIIIDPRMAIKFLTIITSSDPVYYNATLFSDESAVQEACTNKASAFTSMLAGGLVAKVVLDVETFASKNSVSAAHYASNTINFDITNFDLLRI